MTTAASRFYTAQEAFIASVSARPAFVRKKALWRDRGARYLRKSTVPRGSLVQVETDVSRLAMDYIGKAKPTFADAINRHFVPVAEEAFREWPVKTGLSKSLLELSFDLEDDDTFVASLADKAPYAFYINRSKTVRELVFNPGKKAAERIAVEFAEELSG